MRGERTVSVSYRRAAAIVVVVFVAGLAARTLAISPPSSAVRPEPTYRSGVERSGGPGPARVVDGVASGFARTEDGARAASVSFVLTGRVLMSMAPTRVADTVRAMAAEGSAAVQVADAQTQLLLLRDRLAAGTGPVRYEQSILATRVGAYTADRARVSVWSVGVLWRVGAAPPQANWTTSTLELVWEREDWRIWTQTSEPGPTPLPTGTAVPTSAEQLERTLVGFSPWDGGR